MLPWRIVFAGGFGGIAPSLLDRARALYSGEVVLWLAEQEYFWRSALSVALAMLIYFTIGAVVALLSKEEVSHKAVLIGIGAPALIMAAFNPIGDRAKNAEAQIRRAGAMITLFPSAFAQEQTGDYEKQRDVILKPEGCVGCNVEIRGADGTVLKSVPLPADSSAATITIPQGADALFLSGRTPTRRSCPSTALCRQRPGKIARRSTLPGTGTSGMISPGQWGTNPLAHTIFVSRSKSSAARALAHVLRADELTARVSAIA